jgi:hypothetical protein
VFFCCFFSGSSKFQSLLASDDAGINVTRYYKFLSNQSVFKAAQNHLAKTSKKSDKKSDQSVSTSLKYYHIMM